MELRKAGNSSSNCEVDRMLANHRQQKQRGSTELSIKFRELEDKGWRRPHPRISSFWKQNKVKFEGKGCSSEGPGKGRPAGGLIGLDIALLSRKRFRGEPSTRLGAPRGNMRNFLASALRLWGYLCTGQRPTLLKAPTKVALGVYPAFIGCTNH